MLTHDSLVKRKYFKHLQIPGMQSTSPPPPPPYASKHTIIAAPPAVSNRSPLSPTAGKVLSPDPTSPGHRVSTALNITFSSPPPTEANRRDVFIGDSNTRRYTVQRVTNQLPVSSSQVNSSGGSSSSNSSGFNSATSGSNPPADWKHGICAECGGRITNVATACQALGCFYHDKCFVCCCCREFFFLFSYFPLFLNVCHYLTIIILYD
ncbi:unnamed protein product [Rodentolepis nana]|uniref:LIM zinc-binding domain-containing protein n=1 Tax=Rodentolepis nana TaxID=102285 RepID=A0A3P7S9B3_RODNA|nr:unnamed protein product [Rodentolepis nana]